MQPADAAALRSFYEATGGASWSNSSGWSDPVSCDAFGVSCGSAGQVVAITLVKNGLVGSLPTQFGRLTSLMFLRLNKAPFAETLLGPIDEMISGTVPTQIGQLTALRSALSPSHAVPPHASASSRQRLTPLAPHANGSRR